MSRAHFASFQLGILGILLLLLNSPGTSAFNIWFGSAPFCKSNPSNCHTYDFEYILSSSKGSGKECTKGEKVLCQPKSLDGHLKETPSNELVVVAYNVMESPYSAAHNGQTERTCHLPRALLNMVKDVDVIVFTELFIGGCLASVSLADRKVSISDLLEVYGFSHSTDIAGEESRSFYSGNGGTLIVSKWPIFKTHEHTFTAYAGLEVFTQRGAILSTISKRGVNYHILATQLQSDNDVQITQSAEIAEFVKQFDLPLEEALIFAGDFNCEPNKCKQIFENLNADTPTKVGELTANVDYSLNQMVDPNHTAKEWLDFVVYSKQHKQPNGANMEVVQVKTDTEFKYCASATLQPYYVAPTAMMCGTEKSTKDLSDHFPVVARLVFN